MEYAQMTLDQWVSLKDQLKRDILDAKDKLTGLKKDFVRIGYRLRQIEDGKLYERDGYKSVADFAEKECGLTRSDVTRFIQINKRYSVDGYSEELRMEFLEYGSSKLAEMLALPDQDLAMVRPEAAREGIRDLKRFNKSKPAEGVADDIKQLVLLFYKENRNALNTLFAASGNPSQEIELVKDTVNPGGNRSYRKGMFFLMFYENKICVKKFGETPRDMSWEEFARITEKIFGTCAAGAATWEAFFGEPEEREPDPAEEPENNENTEGAEENDGRNIPADRELETDNKDGETGDPGTVERTAAGEKDTGGNHGQSTEQKVTKEEEIAPAQKPPEIQKIQNTEPVQEESSPDMNPPEIIETGITRKEYLETLTPYGMAEELAKASQAMAILNTNFWEMWLETRVTTEGYEIEEDTAHEDNHDEGKE